MFRAVSNMPIFRRLFIAFTLTTVIPGVVIVLLGTFFLNTLEAQGQAVKTSFEAQNTASSQQISLQRMNALLETRFAQIYASKGEGEAASALNASGVLIARDIQNRKSLFDKTLEIYQQKFAVATSDNMKSIRTILLSDDPNNKTIIDQQQAALNRVIEKKEWEKYQQAQGKVLALLEQVESNDPAITFRKAYDALVEARQLFVPLKNSWQNVADSAVTIGTTVTNVGPSQTQPILLFTTTAFLFTILVIIATGYIINLTITQPLHHLALLTRRISRGDTSARAVIHGKDEICLVASSMNNMLDDIVRLIQETQTRHTLLQAQVEKLVSEVSEVGEGDLRIQAEVNTDDLGVLADSFNYMIEELGNLIVRVKILAKEVEKSTTQGFDHMAQLVENSDQQLKQIATATIEVETMATSSRHVAERSYALYSHAREARRSAHESRNTVRQTVTGMDHIHENVQSTAVKVQLLGERSREINNIVEVISSIAHQTNRLALDAAIQAAMAGEHGKGFGAVAADIRRLAERTKEQATIITRLVRNVLEDIDSVAISMSETEQETSRGTVLAQEVGTSLEAIFPLIEQQANEIETINQMTSQQLQSSRAVVQIMHNFSDATQQNSMSTREVSHLMEHIARLAEELLASVEAFKLREDQNYYVANADNFNATLTQEPEDTLSISNMVRVISSSMQSSEDTRAQPY
jgi:methyl-accepting chemotaxis protein